MSGLESATAAIASARRAAAADRRSAMSFDVELRPLHDLAPLEQDWRELIARALEPNTFYEPAFALAAAPLFATNVQAGLVWSRAPRQLVGLFPVRIDRHRYGVPFAVMVGWTHQFAPFGVPLVDRELAEPAIAAWLDHAANDAGLPDLMLLRLIPETGPFAAALSAALARRGCGIRAFDRHERALLMPGDDRAGYLQNRVSSKRVHNLRRRQRRLAELGTVTVVEAKGGDALKQGLDDFMALEAAGWKGRLGTAVSQNEAVRGFMQRAVMGLSAEDKVLNHRLMLDGKAIGATIALRSGDTAWGWKVAYDEAYADYSPGVLAVVGLTESLLADPSVVRADSCASATDTMAPQLWIERLAMTDWLFSTRPGPDFSFTLASRLESLRRTAIAAAKSARDHIRRS